MIDYLKGDLIWYDAQVRGAYGYKGQSHIPAVFVSMSQTGKRAQIELNVLGPGLPHRGWIYVKPTAIWRRLEGGALTEPNEGPKA